jgi:hypothetical protein
MRIETTLVTAPMAANMLGVTPQHVYLLTRQGKLRRALPRKFVFNMMDVLDLRAQRTGRRCGRRPTVGEQIAKTLHEVTT